MYMITQNILYSVENFFFLKMQMATLVLYTRFQLLLSMSSQKGCATIAFEIFISQESNFEAHNKCLTLKF